MNPDLAALWALVEAVPKLLDDLLSKLGIRMPEAAEYAVIAALPAAQAALERVEKIMAHHVDMNDYTDVPKRPMVQAAEDAARIARLEQLLRDTLEIIRVQAPDLYEALDVARAALEGRDE
ncbi:MAG: hypothetical protein HY323_14380 [Betaproteobacteria bacterium]|nr:hypothetical protein [Betaproteobacteria bacterium]